MVKLVTSVLRIVATLLMMGRTSMAISSAKSIAAIRNQIVKDMGMDHIPDVKHANISGAEYARMFEVYQQSRSQTEAIQQLQRHFEQHLASSSLPMHQQTATITERRRRRRNIEE